MLASAALLLVANMSVEPIVTLYVGEIAEPGQDAVLYAGAAMSAAAFAAMLAAPDDRAPGRPLRPLARRRRLASPRPARCWSRRPSSTAPWQLVALRFLMGLALAGLMPAITALIRRSAPDAAIGRILGFSQSAQYFGQIAGPFAGAGGGGAVRHARGVHRHRRGDAGGGGGQRGDAAAGRAGRLDGTGSAAGVALVRNELEERHGERQGIPARARHRQAEGRRRPAAGAASPTASPSRPTRRCAARDADLRRRRRPAAARAAPGFNPRNRSLRWTTRTQRPSPRSKR